MKKFRVLSDIHLDVNEKYPFALKDKSIFTVICGDTSGTPEESINWIKENCPNGVGVSGNHLPYNNLGNSIQALRQELANAFPVNGTFTYLDCETGTYAKEVDGILFVGSCMYTDMHIKHAGWNPSGDMELNMRCSAWNMNDYRWGIKSTDIEPYTKITPKDYYEWFKNAYSKIEEVLNANESQEHPKDVVLVTHHALITDFFDHNGYVENVNYIYRSRDFNWASYASDMKQWLKRHTSIKCYCCGHIHDVYKDYRNFYITRDDESKCLVVNNARGYVSRCHDTYFNPNLFVNVENWTVEEEPLDEEETKRRKETNDKLIKNLAWFM